MALTSDTISLDNLLKLISAMRAEDRLPSAFKVNPTDLESIRQRLGAAKLFETVGFVSTSYCDIALIPDKLVPRGMLWPMEFSSR